MSHQGDGGVAAEAMVDQSGLPAGVEGQNPGGRSGGRAPFTLR